MWKCNKRNYNQRNEFQICKNCSGSVGLRGSAQSPGMSLPRHEPPQAVGSPGEPWGRVQVGLPGVATAVAVDSLGTWPQVSDGHSWWLELYYQKPESLKVLSVNEILGLDVSKKVYVQPNVYPPLNCETVFMSPKKSLAFKIKHSDKHFRYTCGSNLYVQLTADSLQSESGFCSVGVMHAVTSHPVCFLTAHQTLNFYFKKSLLIFFLFNEC